MNKGKVHKAPPSHNSRTTWKSHDAHTTPRSKRECEQTSASWIQNWETVGFTHTFKIHIFWLIECSNHSWLIFFSFFFFLSLFQNLLSYLADEIQSSLNTKVNNLVTWAYLFCLHCPVVIAEMEKYMCSFGDGCLLLTRCPVFVQLQVMLVCIKTFNLL